jgi:hypothetical protein
VKKTVRTLLRWGLVSENGRGPFLAGMERLTQTRCSTALVALDVENGTALTASGRPYRLCGPCDSQFARSVARSIWGVADIRALTSQEAVEMIDAHGNYSDPGRKP